MGRPAGPESSRRSLLQFSASADITGLLMDDTQAKKKACFVISPIGPAESATRKRSHMALKRIFKGALEPLGYEVTRADEISVPGSITLQVLEKILEADLVIADLTDHNPNVFYELAVRHASEKPVIHVIDAAQTIPFDIADLRAIRLELDLNGAERAKAELRAQTEQIEHGHSGQTPVKLAGVLKHLESTKSEENVVVRQLLEAMSELRVDLRATTATNQKTMEAAVAQIESQTLSAIYSLQRNLHDIDRDKERIDPRLRQVPTVTIIRSGNVELGHMLNIDGEDYELPIGLDADAAAEIATKYMRRGMSPAAAVAEVLKLKSRFMMDDADK